VAYIFHLSRHSRGPGGGVPGISLLEATKLENRGFCGWPPNTDSTFGDSRALQIFTVFTDIYFEQEQENSHYLLHLHVF
jgi:hypothetical protein